MAETIDEINLIILHQNLAQSIKYTSINDGPS